MSRVHQALQRAGGAFVTGTAPAFEAPHDDFLNQVPSVPNQLSPDALMLDANNPAAAPSEEFRALRTRLNHMQSRQSIRTVVITSASPAEGKSFTATNLALAQA
jgi:protein-tyrosine kinase